ncbi:MAG: hypothetical protein IJ934_06260 [Acetobacter sp.]|nr:hypothetical protein [Acetobacter sp.]
MIKRIISITNINEIQFHNSEKAVTDFASCTLIRGKSNERKTLCNILSTLQKDYVGIPCSRTDSPETGLKASEQGKKSAFHLLLDDGTQIAFNNTKKTWSKNTSLEVLSKTLHISIFDDVFISNTYRRFRQNLYAMLMGESAFPLIKAFSDLNQKEQACKELDKRQQIKKDKQKIVEELSSLFDQIIPLYQVNVNKHLENFKTDFRLCDIKATYSSDFPLLNYTLQESMYPDHLNKKILAFSFFLEIQKRNLTKTLSKIIVFNDTLDKKYHEVTISKIIDLTKNKNTQMIVLSKDVAFLARIYQELHTHSITPNVLHIKPSSIENDTKTITSYLQEAEQKSKPVQTPVQKVATPVVVPSPKAKQQPKMSSPPPSKEKEQQKSTKTPEETIEQNQAPVPFPQKIILQQDHDIVDLIKYLQNQNKDSNPFDIIRKLRPILETEIRRKHPLCFDETKPQTLTLSLMLRNLPSDSKIFSQQQLEKISEINKFTQNYHHGNFIIPPDPATLERFIKETLDIVGIYYGEKT